MAKLIIVIVAALCLMVATTSARRMANPYEVRGRVYCDYCRAGFETSASKYLYGAKVRLECRHRHSQNVLYSDEAVTDESGTYKFVVKEDQKDNVCDTMLLKSPIKKCSVPDLGRDRSRIVLTSFNGMTSNERFANNMGFLVDEPLGFCTQLLEQYKLDEDEV